MKKKKVKAFSTLNSVNIQREVIIVSTGGTIEKSYNEWGGSLENKGPIIQDLVLKKLRLPYTPVRHFALMSKDSLFITQQDRDLIIQFIDNFIPSAIPIIIIHGTDTMEITATQCFEQLNKKVLAPIIFTGAMRPIGLEDSDGRQNIAEALIAAKILPPGIFISFHNTIFPLPRVRKNKQTLTFEVF